MWVEASLLRINSQQEGHLRTATFSVFTGSPAAITGELSCMSQDVTLVTSLLTFICIFLQVRSVDKTGSQS